MEEKEKTEDLTEDGQTDELEPKEPEKKEGGPSDDERYKRLQRELRELKQQNYDLSNRVEFFAKSAQKPEKPSVDDDEFITGKQFNEVTRGAVEPMAQRLQSLEAQQIMQWRTSIIEKGRERYGEQFDEYFNELDNAARQNPAIGAVIGNSKDPVKAIVINAAALKGEDPIPEIPAGGGVKNRKIKENDQYGKTLTGVRGGKKEAGSMSYEKFMSLSFAERKKIYNEKGNDYVEKLKTEWRNRQDE